MSNLYLLALVAFGVILHIDEPCAEVVKADFNDFSFKVVRQLRLFLEEVRVFGFKVYLCPTVYGPDIAADVLLTGVVVAAVENDDICVAIAVHEFIFHILLIDFKGFGVYYSHYLEDEPSRGQVNVVKVRDIP